MRSAATRPIKILRIITRLNIGGPAQHVVFLTEHLNHGPFSTVLIAGSLGRGDGDMRPLAERREIPLTSVPALSNGVGVVGDLRALLHLYRIISRERPTIAHLHLLKARGLGGIAAKLAGVPVVIETVHGHLLRGYYGPVKSRLILVIERIIGRWVADAVIALSERQRQELLDWRIAPPEKIYVVPIGLELKQFLAAPEDPGCLRRELGAGADVFLLGTVGRLVSIKGHATLLQAVKLVAPVMRDRLMLAIVGDGPLRHHLEADVASLKIGHLVRFLGWRGDMARVYPGLDTIVQPSLNEGTPVSLIEAMAGGRPVIATRVGGVPDVVEDGRSGLLVPPGDPPVLAEAILRLWREPDLRRQLGEEARHGVDHRFSLDRLVAQLTGLYVHMLTAKAASVNQRSGMRFKHQPWVRSRTLGSLQRDERSD